jgi:type IV fimbrial biogenesis protein FimT
MVLNNDMKNLNQTGFTVIELMVVVAMLGIITAIGLPSLRSMLITSEVVETTNDLVLVMKRARSEAMKRGRDVRICSSTDGETCSGSANNWSSGWILFDDANNNGQVDEVQGELIWVKQLDAGSQLTVTATDSAFDVFVDYGYTGVLAGGLAGGFNVCSGYGADGYPRRELRISVSGDVVFLKNTAVIC